MRVGLLAVVAAAVGLAVAPAAGQNGARAEYRVVLPASVQVRPKAAGSVSLTIAAASGHTISRDGPLLIDLKADSDAVILPARRYQRADAADARAADPRFDLGFRIDRAGRYRLALELRFWVCGDRICKPVSTRRTVELVAAEPAPPPDAGISDASP